jgi:hypothetical protein
MDLPYDPQLSRFLPVPPVNSSEFEHEILIDLAFGAG